ncbi:MAG TPA: hypothetical protein VN132_03365 [Bdellovibrio sp.]|nr:hypothetical protein [Bdellovibrio sp.]
MNFTNSLMLISFFGLHLSLASAASSSFHPEVYEFKIKAMVNYRCYGGYGKDKPSDLATKEVCDNKDYKKILIDKIVTIKIVEEATPDGPNYVGDWHEGYEFKGRKFELGLTLFKEIEKQKSYYTLRIAGGDKEENRMVSTRVTIKTPKELNPIYIDRSFIGEPEITTNLWVEAVGHQ